MSVTNQSKYLQKRNNLTACISVIIGQLFGHTSAFFWSDALHRTHKDAINRVSMPKNCLLFRLEAAALVFTKKQ
jgi:hypothetical protein